MASDSDWYTDISGNGGPCGFHSLHTSGVLHMEEEADEQGCSIMNAALNSEF